MQERDETTAPNIVGVPTGLPDRYRIEGVIGSGGFARVFKARDLEQGDVVAVKVVTTGELCDAFEARFGREVAAYRRCRHPNVIAIREAAAGPPVSYIVMDYGEGPTLARRLEQGPLPVDEAVVVAAYMASALAAVHAAGLVHRDVKPANVVFDADGVPIIVDFGLVRGRDFSRLTSTGGVIGTPYYIAPESVAGLEATAAVDVYAWGVLLYEMLTGRTPYDALELGDLFVEIRDRPFPAVTTLVRDVPRGIEDVIFAATRKDPSIRLASPEHCLERLAAVDGLSAATRAHVAEALARLPTIDLPPAFERMSDRRIVYLTPTEALVEARDGATAVRLHRFAPDDERVQVARRMAGHPLHDAVPKVLQSLEWQGVWWFVTERPSGSSLAAVLADQRPLTERRTLDIAVTLAEVLAAYHRAGAVHGAVRPSCVIVEPSGAVRMDVLTVGPSVSGRRTNPYRAPESYDGGAPTPAADVYGLGCVLVDCLALAPPFGRGVSPLRCLSDISPGLAALLERMVTSDPTTRLPDAVVLRQHLSAFVDVGDSAAVSPVSTDPSRPVHGVLRKGMPVAALVVSLVAAGQALVRLEFGTATDRGMTLQSHPQWPAPVTTVLPPVRTDHEAVLAVRRELAAAYDAAESKPGPSLRSVLREGPPVETREALLEYVDAVHRVRIRVDRPDDLAAVHRRMTCLLRSFALLASPRESAAVAAEGRCLLGLLGAIQVLRSREDLVIARRHANVLETATLTQALAALDRTLGGRRPSLERLADTVTELAADAPQRRAMVLLALYGRCQTDRADECLDELLALEKRWVGGATEMTLALRLCQALAYERLGRLPELVQSIEAVWALDGDVLVREDAGRLHAPLLHDLEMSCLEALKTRGGQVNLDDARRLVDGLHRRYDGTQHAVDFVEQLRRIEAGP